jgi:hypothetical protein
LTPLSAAIKEKRVAFGAIDESALASSKKPAGLRIYPTSAPEDDRGIAVYYAPFDFVNTNAKIVLIGITPGESQMQRAWSAAKAAMRMGSEIGAAISEVKRLSSFNDKRNQMRPNLYAQIEHWGIDRWLGLNSGASLFSEGWRFVQTTSLIQFPTFLRGKNYEGKNPPALKHDFLRRVVYERLVPELQSISDALLVPLGGTVEAVIRKLYAEGQLKNPCVYGMLHPSGNNTYRRIYLCGERKEPVPHATSVRSYDSGRQDFQTRFSARAL